MTDTHLSDAILALRAAASDSTAPISVFIDPTLRDDVCEQPDIAQALESGVMLKQKLPPIHRDVDKQKTPYILHAPSEQAAERAIQATFELALQEAMVKPSPLSASRHICGWLIGESDEWALARRMRDLALVVHPTGHKYPFRFWDPRVVWHLPRILPSMAWARLRAMLGTWYALDMQHTLYLLPQLSSTVAQPKPITQADPLRFDAAQWNQLLRLAPTNQILSQAHSDLDMQPTQALAQRIDGLLQTCSSYGFTDFGDQATFAVCGLTTHPQFFRHPRIDARLRKTASDGGTVIMALSAFDDAFWSTLDAQALDFGATAL